MSAKHTPGPWRASNSSVITPQDQILTVSVIGCVYRNNEEEDHANANLISAAPDLLEALQRLLQIAVTRFEADISHPQDIEIVRAAIAKAKGFPGTESGDKQQPLPKG